MLQSWSTVDVFVTQIIRASVYSCYPFVLIRAYKFFCLQNQMKIWGWYTLFLLTRKLMSYCMRGFHICHNSRNHEPSDFFQINLALFRACSPAHNLHLLFSRSRIFVFSFHVPCWAVVMFSHFSFIDLVLRSPQDMMNMCRSLKLNLLSFVRYW